MRKSIKNKLVLCCIFIPLLLLSATTPIVKAYTVPNSDTDSSPVYLMTGDLIKDFKFVSIAGKSIDSGGGAYNNRLKFEISPLWKLERDDIELIYTHQVGNKIYLYYKMALTADMNIYTNCRYVDVCEKQIQDTTPITVWTYKHYEYLTDKELTADAWTKTMNVYSWDFGNVRDFNSKNNAFGGTVIMKFNIKQSPFPASLTDEDGNKLTKGFDYVGVSSAAVLSSDKGSMSQASPDIQYSAPQEDKSPDRRGTSDPSPGTVQKNPDDYDGAYVEFRTNARIDDAGIETWDNGIQLPSGDSSLNPTCADGSGIYDAINETSQKDCALYYNLGSLSPVVSEYFGTVTYNTLDLKEHNEFAWTFKMYQTKNTMTRKISTAIHSTNRFGHSQLQVVLNVYSQYDVQVIDTAKAEDYNLEKPVEYYDNLTWNSAVDGISSGTYEKLSEENDALDIENISEVFNGLFDLLGQVLIYVIIVVIIVVAIYITYRILIAKRSTEYVAKRVIRG